MPILATGSEFPQNLAALLQKNGWCSPELLSQAAQLARQTGRGLGTTLMDMGALSDEQLYGAYSELTGLPRWQKNGEPLGDSDLSPQFMQQNNVLAWRAPDGIYLVLADAEDRGLIDLLHRMYPQAQLAIAPASDIQFYLQQNSAKGAKLESGGALDVEYLKDLALEAPIIRQVNDLILMGVKIGASDIHLEPLKGQVVLRYRIDGVLQTRPGPKSEEYPALVSRLKILANLDIAERRLPQDGRFSLKASGRDVDIRLSTMPTPFGEDVALRLLDQKKELLALDSLGLDKAVTNPLRDVLRRSHGLILVTGPTGSGKTTTLYSALGSIIDGMKKIITVEDPVEYDIPGITQVPVNADIGMGFASALRSILRHDPDVILVGEIRDKETAEIAVQAALTGHLVLSTVHTNSAPAAIARLIQMGVADYLLSSSLLAITGQRLVRKLCLQCRKQISPDPSWNLPSTAHVYQAGACDQCFGTGYKGRLPLGEFLTITPELRQAIAADPTPENLAAIAGHQGYKALLEDGKQKVLAGLTTMDEVWRVAG